MYVEWLGPTGLVPDVGELIEGGLYHLPDDVALRLEAEGKVVRRTDSNVADVALPGAPFNIAGLPPAPLSARRRPPRREE